MISAQPAFGSFPGGVLARFRAARALPLRNFIKWMENGNFLFIAFSQALVTCRPAAKCFKCSDMKSIKKIRIPKWIWHTI